jgi:hypothetical protein
MHQCGHIAPASVFCVLFPVFCVWRRGWGVGKGTCPLPHRASREARFFVFAESGESSGGRTTNGAKGEQGAKLLMPRHRHGLVRPGTAHCTEPPCHPDWKEGFYRTASRAMALHRATSEIVHSVHCDMVFYCFFQRTPTVILTPSAQLRACSGRDLTTWHWGPWPAVLRR